MLMQIGQKLESDFSEPIGMLEDCHKRILYFLRSLATIAEAADEGRLSVEHRDSLEKALKYFREAAPKHTADEEESLFPQLRLIDNLQVRTVFAKLDGLEADHRWADAQHREIDTIGRLWLSSGVCADENRHRFKTLLEYLLKFYARHIALEESEIFSIARSLLPESTRRQLGREMAQRRGITEQ